MNDRKISKKIEDVIIKNRSKFYNCSEDVFFKPGTNFRYSEGLDKEPLIYITELFGHTFISSGKDSLPLLKDISNDGSITLNYDQLKKNFPNLRLDEVYPHYIYNKKSFPEIHIAEGYEIRKMDPSDHPPLQVFLDSCTEEDIEDALIMLDDPDEEIHMVYKDGVPVVYAGYRLWENGLGDTGILVHKEHRKKGLGVAAVSSVTRGCMENGHFPFYRTSRENKGSSSIALKVGYELVWETLVYKFDK
ncbi:MAG: GNAT family N-acetyltransferase [Spirochaetales bacterium]|nr:GNAT family N-acetyltransferase [Spirochaetales bacterium]